jgi:phage terminase large subunit
MTYSYKTDKHTGEILPIIVDKKNHCVDALRYALEKRMKNSTVFIA